MRPLCGFQCITGPSWAGKMKIPADAMAWHPWDEENTDSLEDVLATDDAPDPTQEDTSDPPGPDKDRF